MAGRFDSARTPSKASLMAGAFSSTACLVRSMSALVYILRCSDNTLYVGSTTDLPRRIQQHNEGRGGRYTAARLPVTLLYSETHNTLSAAIEREQQVKRWTRVKKQALIEGRTADLKRLARRRR
jgi:putative endonuclease